MTVTGKTLAENLHDVPDADREVIRPYDKPLLEHAGYVVMSGNLFDSAVMKISVIDQDFRALPLRSRRAQRVRGQGDRVRRPGGLPPPHRGPRPRRGRTLGADHPQLRPGRLSRQRRGGEHAAAGLAAASGIDTLPTMGDGRQSGTSGSPSILNVSPEAAVGGGLALLKTGDRIRIDLNTRKVDLLLPEANWRRGRRPGRRRTGEHDTVGRDLPQHGRATRHRRLPGTGDALPEHHRDPRREPATTTEDRHQMLIRHRMPVPTTLADVCRPDRMALLISTCRSASCGQFYRQPWPCRRHARRRGPRGEADAASRLHAAPPRRRSSGPAPSRCAWRLGRSAKSCPAEIVPWFPRGAARRGDYPRTGATADDAVLDKVAMSASRARRSP